MDGIDYTIEAIVDIIIQNSHDLIPFSTKYFGPLCIGCEFHISGVGCSIDLEDKVELPTEEVSEVAGDGRLANELIAVDLPVADVEPELPQTFEFCAALSTALS
jgi:hypothetical protein